MYQQPHHWQILRSAIIEAAEANMPSLAAQGTAINNFLAYYRATSPQAMVSPKLHVLGDYVIPLLK